MWVEDFHVFQPLLCVLIVRHIHDNYLVFAIIIQRKQRRQQGIQLGALLLVGNDDAYVCRNHSYVNASVLNFQLLCRVAFGELATVVLACHNLAVGTG